MPRKSMINFLIDLKNNKFKEDDCFIINKNLYIIKGKRYKDIFNKHTMKSLFDEYCISSILNLNVYYCNDIIDYIIKKL